MNLQQSEQQKAAQKFAEEWKGKGYEKGEGQKFWIDLLCNVFGVKDFARQTGNHKLYRCIHSLYKSTHRTKEHRQRFTRSNQAVRWLFFNAFSASTKIYFRASA